MKDRILKVWTELEFGELLLLENVEQVASFFARKAYKRFKQTTPDLVQNGTSSLYVYVFLVLVLILSLNLPCYVIINLLHLGSHCIWRVEFDIVH